MKKYVQAARLRTLPLSISGILMGSAYAYSKNKFEILIFIFALLTTLSFQILSNFANDYGDGIKGTDSNRKGEKRLVASGEISAQAMKKTVQIVATLSGIFAITLIYLAFGKENFLYSLLFLVLGGLSIWAAIKYTVGKNAYGYSGFGDVFVFVFFGLVAVLGSHFLFTKTLDWKLIFAALSIGCFSVAVLNLNNMRDIENDGLSQKNTLVVKNGLPWAKKYHGFLLFIAYFSIAFFGITTKEKITWVGIILVFLLIHYKKIRAASLPEHFDPELKKIALCAFFISVVYWLQLLF